MIFRAGSRGRRRVLVVAANQVGLILKRPDDAVYVAAADAARGLRRDAAGAHGANAAAGAGFAEAAVRRLILDALLPGIRANFFAGFKQFVGRCFHLFNCD